MLGVDRKAARGKRTNVPSAAICHGWPPRIGGRRLRHGFPSALLRTSFLGSGSLFVILTVWVLLNILYVLIVIPPRKPRSRSRTSGTTLSPAPIDKSPSQVDRHEPSSFRHVVMLVAIGLLFTLVPPLIAIRDAIARFFRQARGDDA